MTYDIPSAVSVLVFGEGMSALGVLISLDELRSVTVAMWCAT